MAKKKMPDILSVNEFTLYLSLVYSFATLTLLHVELTWHTLTNLFSASEIIQNDLALLGISKEQLLTDSKTIQDVAGDNPINSHIFIAPDNGGNREEEDIKADFENSIRSKLGLIHLLAGFLDEIKKLEGSEKFIKHYPYKSLSHFCEYY